MTAPSPGDQADAQGTDDRRGRTRAQSTARGGRRADRTPATTRRGFVRAAGVGVAAAGLGLGVPNATLGQESEGIPTPWLERDGNLIVDQQGSPVTLRGVNIADPAQLDNQDQRYHVDAVEVTDRALDESDGWYNRILRIPIQTADIADRGSNEVDPGVITQSQVQSYVEDHLRPVVDRCAEQGAYCIVDYHRHSDSQLLYTDDALDTEVRMFWETVAPEFAEDSHVLFEVYNEPIAPYPGHNDYGQGAGVDVTEPSAEETWDTWREAAQPWVDTIRDNAPRNLIIVGSPRWTQWTYWAGEGTEFEGENLAYAGHVYAHENLRPLDTYFGTPAESVPVFMTEFGYDDEGQSYIKGTTSEEGEEFRTFFEDHPHVHWQVWCFDPRWEPAMFSEDQGEWTLRSGEGFHGEFFKAYLQEKRNDRLPGGGGGQEEPLPAPIDLSASVSGTAVELTWSAVDAATSYTVLLDGSTYDSTASTSTTITELSPETEYEFGVQASNSTGTSDVVTTVVSIPSDPGGGPTCGGQPVNATATVDGRTVCDVNGDELYRDVSADGAVSQTDVVEFFNVQHREPWKQPSMFDFSGDGSVGHGDVVALFDYVASSGL